MSTNAHQSNNVATAELPAQTLNTRSGVSLQTEAFDAYDKSITLLRRFHQGITEVETDGTPRMSRPEIVHSIKELDARIVSDIARGLEKYHEFGSSAHIDRAGAIRAEDPVLKAFLVSSSAVKALCHNHLTYEVGSTHEVNSMLASLDVAQTEAIKIWESLGARVLQIATTEATDHEQYCTAMDARDEADRRNQEADRSTEEDVANWPGRTGGNWT